MRERELLKEAAEILGDCYYNGKEPLLDGTRAKIAKTIKRIEAAIAEPEPDAMEIAYQIKMLWADDHNGERHDIFCHDCWKKYQAEAAALIADFGRRVPQWISVKEWLPESLVGVLVRYTSSYGKSHTTIAQYTAPKTVLEEDFLDEDAEGCSEYDEEKDCYWVDEGWWENSWESEKNWKLTGTINHWMPLPEPPVGKEGEE